MSSKEQQSSLSHSEESQSNSKQQKSAKKNKSKNKQNILLNISDCQYIVVNKVAKSLGWKLQRLADASDWDVCWTDNAVQPEVLSRMQMHQKINHFPGMYNLARKNLLGRGLMRMRKKFSQDYSFFPLTWMLPVEYHELKAYYQSKPKGKARTFIVKPQASSQGKGIYLTRKIQNIDSDEHCIVQRYLSKPYLIDGLKFDLRIYILLAGVDPLRIYYFHEGLGRFATQTYEAPNKDNMQDVCMHLTNYAINKDNPKFIFNKTECDMTVGHKKSLTAVFDILKIQGVNTDELKQKIQDIIVKTIISGLPHLTNSYNACQSDNFANDMCFELLGFDIMLTEKCQPILLQINHTPSFTIDTPLDTYIKTNYIKDTLKLMNINQKRKKKIIKQRKQATLQRIITGKKNKLTLEQRTKLKQQAKIERDIYQNKNLGGFQRIYPVNDEKKMAKYHQFCEYAHQNYYISTVGKRKVDKKDMNTSNTVLGRKQSKQQKPKKVFIPAPINKKTNNFIKANMIFPKKQKQKQTNIEENADEQLSSKPSLVNLEELSEKVISMSTNPKQKQSDIQHNPFQFDFESEKILPKKPSLKYINTKISDLCKNTIQNQHISYANNRFIVRQSNDLKKQKTMKIKDECLQFQQKKHMLRQNKTQGKDFTQRQKIPITLNTLLINGLETNHHTQLSVNNLKKILNQQKYKKFQ